MCKGQNQVRQFPIFFHIEPKRFTFIDLFLHLVGCNAWGPLPERGFRVGTSVLKSRRQLHAHRVSAAFFFGTQSSIFHSPHFN